MQAFFGVFDSTSASVSPTAAATGALTLLLLTHCLPIGDWVRSGLPGALCAAYTRVWRQHQDQKLDCIAGAVSSSSGAQGHSLSWAEFPSLVPFLMYAASTGAAAVGGCDHDLPCLSVPHLLRALCVYPGLDPLGESPREAAAADVEAAGLNWWFNNTRLLRDMTSSEGSCGTDATNAGSAGEPAPDLPPLPPLLYRSSLALELLQRQEQR